MTQSEETVKLRMKEMTLCLVEQNLNKIPWGVTLEEFLKLLEIVRKELHK